MKTIIRNIILYASSLFAASQLIEGIKISGGIQTYLIGGVALYAMSLFVRPILNIVTFPIHLITLGAFSFLIQTAIHVIILYLLTVFVPQISVKEFVFYGAAIAGFVIPKISFGPFLAFVVSAVVLSSILSLLKWVMKE